MDRVVQEHAGRCAIVIMAAAVSDFRPTEAVDRKIKKDDAAQSIPLTRTRDILQGLGSNKAGRILVGFAAETDDLVTNAGEKLRRKNLDLIVANDVGRRDSGFASETNAAVLVDRTGKVMELPLMPKAELASRIIDAIVELKKNQGL
jgi:phosphopantothenoylcysteine decarboxylase/phosphopantothenate--cysteine ligase